jgi:hypothetical protein
MWRQVEEKQISHEGVEEPEINQQQAGPKNVLVWPKKALNGERSKVRQSHQRTGK